MKYASIILLCLCTLVSAQNSTIVPEPTTEPTTTSTTIVPTTTVEPSTSTPNPTTTSVIPSPTSTTSIPVITTTIINGSTVTQTITTNPTTTQTPASPSSSSSNLNDNTRNILIGVGASVGGIALLALLFFLYNKVYKVRIIQANS